MVEDGHPIALLHGTAGQRLHGDGLAGVADAWGRRYGRQLGYKFLLISPIPRPLTWANEDGVGDTALSTGLEDVIGDGRTVCHMKPLPLPGDLWHRESTDCTEEERLDVTTLAPEQGRDIATWEGGREGGREGGGLHHAPT